MAKETEYIWNYSLGIHILKNSLFSFIAHFNIGFLVFNFICLVPYIL